MQEMPIVNDNLGYLPWFHIVLLFCQNPQMLLVIRYGNIKYSRFSPLRFGKYITNLQFRKIILKWRF